MVGNNITKQRQRRNDINPTKEKYEKKEQWEGNKERYKL